MVQAAALECAAFGEAVLITDILPAQVAAGIALWLAWKTPGSPRTGTRKFGN